MYNIWSEAKAACIRCKEIPALAYLNDFRLRKHVVTEGFPVRDRWLAAAGEATHVAMLASFMCDWFLSVKKCGLCPTQIQQYIENL